MDTNKLFLPINEDFKTFCERYELFTDSGNYSTTAETMYKYITNKIDFVEEHTGLSDVMIEKEIFVECLRRGVEDGKLW